MVYPIADLIYSSPLTPYFTSNILPVTTFRCECMMSILSAALLLKSEGFTINVTPPFTPTHINH